MDDSKRTKRYSFRRQVFTSLIVIGFLYILFIRPVQSFFVRELILPAFDSMIKEDSDIISEPGIDEFFLSSVSNAFPTVKIEVPFNGYFWLATAFIRPSKNRRFGQVIWFYNWALFLIIPISALGIIYGYTWLAFLTNVHEKVYKAIFLILGILALKDTAEKLKD